MEKELIGSGGTGAAARIALPGTDGVTGPAGGIGTNTPAGITGINTPGAITGANASTASAGFTGTFRAAPGSARTDGVAPASGLTATGPAATAGSPGAPRTNGTGRTTGAGGPHTAVGTTSSVAGTGPWWLPGVVGELPMGEPDWVSFVRDVIADAPPEAVIAERDHPGLTGFALVVAPFAERAAGRLLTSPSNNAVRAGTAVGLAPVLEDFRSHLTRRLARLAARTLVLELHKARRAGRLAGDGPEARFRDFLRVTGGARRAGRPAGWSPCSRCTAPPAGPRPGGVPSAVPSGSPSPRSRWPGASRRGPRGSAGRCCASPRRGAVSSTVRRGCGPCAGRPSR
ncbi:hypothetical protein SMICM304S_07416 [Streptomyces microflavus]